MEDRTCVASSDNNFIIDYVCGRPSRGGHLRTQNTATGGASQSSLFYGTQIGTQIGETAQANKSVGGSKTRQELDEELERLLLRKEQLLRAKEKLGCQQRLVQARPAHYTQGKAGAGAGAGANANLFRAEADEGEDEDKDEEEEGEEEDAAAAAAAAREEEQALVTDPGSANVDAVQAMAHGSSTQKHKKKKLLGLSQDSLLHPGSGSNPDGAPGTVHFESVHLTNSGVKPNNTVDTASGTQSADNANSGSLEEQYARLVRRLEKTERRLAECRANKAQCDAERIFIEDRVKFATAAPVFQEPLAVRDTKGNPRFVVPVLKDAVRNLPPLVKLIAAFQPQGIAEIERAVQRLERETTRSMQQAGTMFMQQEKDMQQLQLDRLRTERQQANAAREAQFTEQQALAQQLQQRDDQLAQMQQQQAEIQRAQNQLDAQRRHFEEQQQQRGAAGAGAAEPIYATVDDYANTGVPAPYD